MTEPNKTGATPPKQVQSGNSLYILATMLVIGGLTMAILPLFPWYQRELATITSNSDSSKIEKLSARMDEVAAALEVQTKAAPIAAANNKNTDEEIATLKTDVARLNEELGALPKRLEQSGKTQQANAKEILAFIIMRDDVLGHRPFARSMQKFLGFADYKSQLAPLTPYAESGLPELTGLRKDLPAPTIAAEGTATGNTWSDRIASILNRFVTVKRIDAGEADALSALDKALAENKIDEAQKLISTMDDDMRSKVKAIEDALSTIQQSEKIISEIVQSLLEEEGAR